jgi:iron complex outermembrane receptor protein
VYEAGYRGQSPRFSYSITYYHADYDHLHTQELAPSRTSIIFSGRMQATTDGVEAWGAWQVAGPWRLSAGYTAQREHFRLRPDSLDPSAVGFAARDPAHAWLLRSSLDLFERCQLDVTVRGVAALSNPPVPRYATMDVRLGWKPRPDLEFSLVGRNLADGGHGEFTSIATRTEIDRSVYVSLRWDFDTR